MANREKAKAPKHTTDEISGFMLESDKDFPELSESYFDDNLDPTDLSSNSCQSENEEEIVDQL